MKKTKHPIQLPDSLINKWLEDTDTSLSVQFQEAAEWGSDQELEACCQSLYNRFASPVHQAQFLAQELRDWLLAARRPNPPSLKEQALLQLDTLNADLAMHGRGCDLSQIRRALEALPE
jgi:hypothetical protein